MRGLIANLFKEFMGPLGLSAPVPASKTVSLLEPSETVSAPMRHTAWMPLQKVTASTVHKPTGKTRLDCTNCHASLSDADAPPRNCVNERLVTPHMRKNIFGNKQTVSPNFLNIYFCRSDIGDASAARTRAVTTVKGKGHAKKPAAETPTMSATDQSQAKTMRAS